MKRVITITMDIDESTHEAKVISRITEDGKVKKEWTPAQGVSTALALVEAAKILLNDLNNYCVDIIKREEQK